MALEITKASASISIDSLGPLCALNRLADRIRAWFHFSNSFHSDGRSKRQPSQSCSERERIAQDLHDTLLQGFLGAYLLLGKAVNEIPDDSPFKPSVSRALRLIHQAVDDGRKVLQGLQSTWNGSEGLDGALVRLQDEVASGRNVRLRVFVQGKRRALARVVEEQIYRIGREAVVNALRHSGAKLIEVELEYNRRTVRLLVRDDGCGFDSGIIQSSWDSHWGFRSMHDRATSIRADLRVWSRPGAGTEIEVSTPTVKGVGRPC